MARRSVKRPAVRVRCEFSDTPYMRSALQEPDYTRPRLRLLEEKRAALLGDIHQREQKLQRLDYLRYELQKAKGASDL